MTPSNPNVRHCQHHGWTVQPGGQRLCRLPSFAKPNTHYCNAVLDAHIPPKHNIADCLTYIKRRCPDHGAVTSMEIFETCPKRSLHGDRPCNLTLLPY